MVAKLLRCSGVVFGKKEFAFGAHVTVEGQISRRELLCGDGENRKRRRPWIEEAVLHRVRSVLGLGIDLSVQHDK
jgi:hypothetical protein